MAVLALTDATTYVSGYDMTTDLNEVNLSASGDELDTTTFGGAGYRSRIGGLRTVEAQLNGFWQSAASAAVDPQVFPNLGTADVPVTMAFDDAEGSAAYLFLGGRFNYTLGGEIGAVLPFQLGMMGTNAVGLARGMIVKGKGNISGTGATGSVVQLGAVATGQYLYAVVHTFSIGTSFTLQIQSDDAAGMASPTTQITLGSVTAVGATWGTRVAGPITDTHYRVNVSAASGTSQIAVAVGIA